MVRRRFAAGATAAAALVLGACGCGVDHPAAAAAAQIKLTTSPPLRPAYSAGTPDYVVRCRRGTPVKVKATIPSGQSVSVDGQPAAEGSLEQNVSIDAGQAFTFTVNGTATHNVRCVPRDFPLWRVERHGTPVSPFIALAPTEREKQPPRPPRYNIIADDRGVPVWWKLSTNGIPTDTTVLPDGTVLWGILNGPFSESPWTHVTLDGTELRPLDTVGVHADHHYFEVLPNGNHLMIAYPPRRHVDLRRLGGPRDATVFDGEVQELTPEGQLVWSWSTKGHVRLNETDAWRFRKIMLKHKGRPAVDLIHMNSVQYVGPDLLFSGKDVNAVYLVRRSDGKILWKLGGTHRAESLKVKGDRYGKWPVDGQHDARIHPDGTLSVHDNGTFGRKRLPRVVRYRINRRKKTATLIQQITDKRVGHSYCCGNAQRLSKGRWLVDWGANPVIEELTGRGRRVLTITLPNKIFSYRAQSVPPGVLTREALRAGMNAMFPR